MKPTVQLLIIEDNESDIDILKRLLRRSGLDMEPAVADELPEILGLLDTRPFDAVLTDHQLASFTALEVLSAVSGRGMDIPVIVVSGAVGEDRAAELMRKGAADFIRKDNLSRLMPALIRELRESEARKNLREATESRARSESLLRLVVELSGDSFWEWDLDTGRVNWSDTFLVLCGAGPRPAPHIDVWRERLHPEDRNYAVAGIDEAIRSGSGHWSGTFRFLRNNGSWALLTARCFVVREQGLAVRVIGAMADITERQSLIERQRLFTELVDQASDSIAVIDPDDGRFLEFNAAAHVSLGYSQSEFASLTLFDIDCQRETDDLCQLLRKLRGLEVRDMASQHRCKNGRVLQVRIHSRPIHIQGRTYLATAWMDQTERIAIEAELRQAQKMEILGQIAGGVSHDFNNILAVMRLQLDLGLMKPLEPGESQTLMQTLSGMVDRATNLTRHLLNLSRKDKFNPETFAIDEALDELVAVIRRILGTGIEIRRIPCRKRVLIQADRSIMEQVFMNLLVNARDAMPVGGILTIKTLLSEDHPPGDDGLAQLRGRFVVVHVGDTGVGMSKETLAHIEEPFFTTKEPGKGTGLGISTARRCLRDHGGWMTVESEPGRGSIFRVHLPVVEADQAGSDPIEPEDSGRPARVLLLMKDSQLRMLARKTLENMGFLVQACSNPVETVRTIESEAAYFDLAIVPSGMPINDMREELAHRVRTRLPSVPMIVTRSPDGDAATLPPGECRVLDVPFSIADFIALVKASLPHGAVPRLRP